MKLFLDACTIIYLIESQEQLGHNTRTIITEALQNKAQLVVSRLSFLECRVLPLKTKDDDLILRYNHFFTLPDLEVIELTEDVINLATDLRANYTNSLRTPDAIQVACALKASANTFFTGDKKLGSIQEIDIFIIS